MKGIVIESSLKDSTVLDSVHITRSWESGSWRLHEVAVSEEEAIAFAGYLNEGPWFVHFWNPGEDSVLVIFKDKIFRVSHSNTITWSPAIKYGKTINIPEAQLNFPID